MAGHVNEVVFDCEHFDAERRQLVVQRVDADLIAGNDARRENDGIARPKTNGRMNVDRNPEKRRLRFALTAGSQVEGAPRRHLPHIRFIQPRRRRCSTTRAP